MEENEEQELSFPLNENESFKKISVRNLCFSYGNRGNTLENINLEINAGEKVWFVGSSGSGKTTLMKLLLKFYLPDRGEILLNSKNIKDYNTKDYRTAFGYVPQEILLFSGTIYENIAIDVFGRHKKTYTVGTRLFNGSGAFDRQDLNFRDYLNSSLLSGGDHDF